MKTDYNYIKSEMEARGLEKLTANPSTPASPHLPNLPPWEAWQAGEYDDEAVRAVLGPLGIYEGNTEWYMDDVVREYENNDYSSAEIEEWRDFQIGILENIDWRDFYHEDGDGAE